MLALKAAMRTPKYLPYYRPRRQDTMFHEGTIFDNCVDVSVAIAEGCSLAVRVALQWLKTLLGKLGVASERGKCKMLPSYYLLPTVCRRRILRTQESFTVNHAVGTNAKFLCIEGRVIPPPSSCKASLKNPGILNF